MNAPPRRRLTRMGRRHHEAGMPAEPSGDLPSSVIAEIRLQRSAAAGLTPTLIDSQPWVRTEDGSTAIVHVFSPADTLFTLSGRYFGSSTIEGVRRIHRYARNYALQGPDPSRGLNYGDKILIPLTPPPNVTIGGGDDGDGGIDQVIDKVTGNGNGNGNGTDAVDKVIGTVVDIVTDDGDKVTGKVTAKTDDGDLVVTDDKGDRILITKPPAAPPGKVQTKKEGETFWTPARIAIAVGAVGLGLLLFVALTTQKKKPRRRRRRKVR